MNTDMTGRVCLITGANSGIGKETALALAKMDATLILVCRDAVKGKAVIQEIEATSGNKKLNLMLADMSSVQSIRALAKQILEKYPKVHVLVNNAGSVFSERLTSKDGFEMTFALNHLGYFLLTQLLLDRIKESAPSRIVSVASEAQQAGRINFEDLQSEKSFSGFTAYGTSKLMNVLFTYELDRRLNRSGSSGVTANAMHPGGVATNFAANTSGLFTFFWKLITPFLLTPAQGAETVIYLASSPEVEGISGKYFIKKKPARSVAVSYDEAVAKRLWEVSEKLTGDQI
ncbi:MAG: SDR family oxidoreductase [Rhizobacter sp.]|nr:SDR family oxidoreductase [Chlorobiales bacterium]